MIDVHAHFASEGYDLPAEWQKIRAAGVTTVILAADTLANAAFHADFAREHEGCFFTVGVHPEFAEADFDEAAFRALAAQKKCVAVGEIGLDYHYGTETKTAQRKRFTEQLLLADALSLPVQIHSRDACADTLAILREFREKLARGFLMHCYSYGRENLSDFLDLGAYFSFGGVVCFKNAKRVIESVRFCPIARILTETDSPFLSPFRGEKNSPANLPVIVEKIAEVKGISPDAVKSAVRENAARLFPKLL